MKAATMKQWRCELNDSINVATLSSFIPHPSSLPFCVRISSNEEIEGEKKECHTRNL
jgi:hypothetical protein